MRPRPLLRGAQPDPHQLQLEEAHSIAPDDAELQFVLASGYLRVNKVEEAARLFAQVAKARPIPATWLLIGRTYRDAGQYARAREALQRAIKMDPTVHRAHYYLGTVALLEEGLVRLDEAIREFQRELELTPGDPITTLRLGMALVLAQRATEALPLLERIAREAGRTPEAFYYLGRAQLSAGQPAIAVGSFRRALELYPGHRSGQPTRSRSGTVRRAARTTGASSPRRAPGDRR